MRAYLRLGLFFYFKNIKVVNAKSLPKKDSVLFLANHQNALLDALLIATKNGRFSYFLTRASVFNNALIGKILKSLLMLPVYRVRDGWSNLTKNNSVFSTSAKLLSENKAIVIFPEGSHNLNRTVRPLSKGFTRIIFETLERYPNTKIQLIPVGLNFIKAEKFGDSALINFGNAIEVHNDIIIDKNKSVIQLKETIFNQLINLTTHIEAENYEATVQKLENLNVDFLNPEAVNNCIANNFKDCKTSKENNLEGLKAFFKFLLSVSLFMPYLVWKKVFQPKIKEIEFTSTFRFAIAISLVPLFIVLVMLILALLFSFKVALIYLVSVLLLTLLAVKL